MTGGVIRCYVIVTKTSSTGLVLRLRLLLRIFEACSLSNIINNRAFGDRAPPAWYFAIQPSGCLGWFRGDFGKGECIHRRKWTDLTFRFGLVVILARQGWETLSCVVSVDYGWSVTCNEDLPSTIDSCYGILGRNEPRRPMYANQGRHMHWLSAYGPDHRTP